MTKLISPKEQKRISLNMLVKFANFCDEHNLYYTLAGGTLLGAIRHRGFIPWDDDIDINMPRADFEKLRKILLKENISDEISFADIAAENNIYPFYKIYDNRTIQESSDLSKIGIWIDIFPVDNCKNDEVENKRLFKKARFWRAAVISLNSDLLKSKGILKNNIKFAFKVAGKLLGKQFFLKQASKNAMKYRECETECVAGILWGYGIGEVLQKNEYLNSEKVEFEGYYFNAPKGWHKYLKGLYGDYMKLPPKEKQVAHGVVATWKE